MAGAQQCLTVLVLLTKFVISTGVQCLSPTGQPIDWYIVYKLPDNVEGVATDSFYYMDAKSLSWQLSDKTINQTGHAVYYTLNQIYKSGDLASHKDWRGQQTDLLYAMYNDQEKPKSGWYKESEHGHTKGVVAFDETSGFWLVHSTPHFPPPREAGYSWPDSASIYGQTFLCVSMDTNTNLDLIGKQFLYNYPHIYDSASSPFFDKFPNMAAALKNKHVTEAPWTSEVRLTSLGGVSFYSFAKFATFNADLYADWIAPRLKASLYVETWQNGRNKLCSNCTGQYKVYNVETISFGEEPGAIFTETKDHSKWAVTMTSDNSWTCIGDINRQESQMTRPGGTVCFQNPSVWNSFMKLVSQYHNCDPYGNCVKG